MSHDSTPPLMMNARPVAGDNCEFLVWTNCTLLMVCVAFVGYLTIPQGTRRRYCNSYRRRFLHSSFISRGSEEATQLPVVAAPDKFNVPFESGYISFALPTPSGSYHGSFLFPSALILNPVAACTSNERIPAVNQRIGYLKSPPSSQLFTPIETAKKHLRRTPTTAKPTTIEEINSESPNSVMEHTLDDSQKKLLVLISNRCLDPQQEQNQRDAIALLRQRRVQFETVDGMKGMQRSRREELYRISGTRAKYPQFFFVHNDGRTTYFGDFTKLLRLHHAEGLPRRYRMANPDIATWDEVFCDTSQIFSV